MTFKSFFAISVLTLNAFALTLVTHSAQEVSTEAQFSTEVLQSAKPVVVKFSAAWCGPCKQMAPMFEEVSHEAAFQNVKFVKVDTDKSSQIATNYNIRSVPTTIFFKNGKEVGRISGAPSKQEFMSKIKSYFSL